MRTILITILALIAITAHAETTEVIAGVYTTHFADDAQQYNNDNRLVAIRYHTLIGGTFINSYHQRTYFAGAIFEREAVLSGHRFSYGFSTGAMHGYCWEAFQYGKPFHADTCEQVVTPYLAPFVGYRYDALSLRVLSFGTSLTVTLGFEL